MNDRIEIGTWSSVSDSEGDLGSYLNCGELGLETYAPGDVLLGMFADEDEAVRGLYDYRESQSNGGSPPTRTSERPESMLVAALDWVGDGWTIFPAPPGEKKSYKSAKYSGGAKWGATRNPEQVRRDFQRWPDANIGIPTGKDNAVWVLEADTLKGHNVDGIASLRALEAQHGPLPDTLMAESPSGSLHYYFDWPKGVEIRNSASVIGPGIDVRGEGGMVLAPPSMRGDGEYRWINDNDIAEAPQWLIDLVVVTSKSTSKIADGGAPQPPRIKISPLFANVPVRSLGDGIVLQKYPPQPLEPILAECGWLRHVHATGGSDQTEPLWWDALRCCNFLLDGKNLIHKFSKGHAGYGIEKTEAKFDHVRKDKIANDFGYPKCQTICDHGSEHCKSCPHFAAGGSPLNLAPQQALPPQPGAKLLLMIELGSKLWGAPTAVIGKEYQFGADQTKAVDPGRGTWFDFTTSRGGYLKDLMKRVATAATREQPNADDVVVVCAADVVMRPLDWIWEGHLLRGSQELLSGLPDLSKSTVQINYIACATARLPWPDGAPAIEPMNVVMLTAEDTLEQIVVPRLRAAGADLSRVKFLKCIKTDEHDRQFLLAEDLDKLERLVKKIGDVGLITIDPITAYMGGRIDSHKATEVRAQLGPLKDFSERMNIALSTITHPPKSAGPSALNHFIGSQAFIAACRVGHLCIAETEEKDGEYVPTGRILFTNVRNTAYRQRMPTLAYRKVEVTVGTVEQGFKRPVTAPQIAWEGPVDITADAAVAAASGKKSDQQPKAQAFLREMLKDGKPVPQKEIQEAATAKGFTDKQLRTAGEKLGVHVNKEPGKMDGGWFWQLPDPSDGKYYY